MITVSDHPPRQESGMDREPEERSAAVKFTTVNGSRGITSSTHAKSPEEEPLAEFKASQQHILSNPVKPEERKHETLLSKRVDEEDHGSRHDAGARSSEDKYPFRPTKRKRSLDSYFRKSPEFHASDPRRSGTFLPQANTGSPPRSLPPLTEFGTAKPTSASDQPPVWLQKRPVANQREEQLAEAARRDSHQVYQPHREQTDAGDDAREPDSDSDGEDDRQREARSVQKHSDRPRTRNFSQRTKTGCHTCRRRKKKCDEAKPVCENCSRGNFICEGYGPKSELNMKLPSKTVPLQAKGLEGHGPSPYRQSAHSTSNEQWPETHRRYPHDNRMQPANDGYGYGAAPAPRSLLHSEFGSPLPPDRFGRAPFPETARAAPHASRFSMIAPPSVISDNNGRGVYHGGVGGRHGSISSGLSTPRTSVGTLSAFNPPTTTYASFRPAPTISDMEKSNMLSGQPFRHFTDAQLRNDRAFCQEAVERFNEASKPSRGTSLEECQRLFVEILRPDRLLREAELQNHPVGSVGNLFIVEAPFHCDYGYNIHLGEDVVIQTGCAMYDPCTISIGARTIIGPNVKFYGMGPSTDPKNRNGSNSKMLGGTITIEEDCWIGGDVIIMANVTIKRGSVIEAGTKVTKSVAPESFYDGESMRILRERGLTADDEYPAHAPPLAPARFDPYMNR